MRSECPGGGCLEMRGKHPAITEATRNICLQYNTSSTTQLVFCAKSMTHKHVLVVVPVLCRPGVSVWLGPWCVLVLTAISLVYLCPQSALVCLGPWSARVHGLLGYQTAWVLNLSSSSVYLGPLSA